MALITKEWNYIRINKEALRQALGNVRYHTYRDKEVRLSPGTFDLSPESTQEVVISNEFLDSLMSALYKEFKTFDKFLDCKDD